MTTYPGMRYDERRQWFLPQGVVARDLASHPLFPRPKRDSRAVAFDELSDNTTLGIHLSEIAPGGSKRGHRHLDEAIFYIVSGRGWTELKQADDAEIQRVEWRAGTLMAIPVNAWHQHFNADETRPALQLAFKNTRFLRRMFGSRDFVYANSFRFHDRYDDQLDYWTSRRVDDNGVVHTNMVVDLHAEQLPVSPEAGRLVSQRHFRMGGHRLLWAALVEIGSGGYVKDHQHLAEEAILFLEGSGRTVMYDTDRGREVTIQWAAGDLLCPPFGVRHKHLVDDGASVRLLAVRNMFVHEALGMSGTALGTQIPSRFPTVLEPSREVVDEDRRD